MNEFLHILGDVLRNALLITGLVMVMMMMIESVNISSGGRIFSKLGRNRVGNVVLGAILGCIPGCLGGFATVSLYTHRILSFGALIAMMIASSGDEAFVMLAAFPKTALWIFAGLFVLAVACGLVVDIFARRKDNPELCGEMQELHAEDLKPEAIPGHEHGTNATHSHGTAPASPNAKARNRHFSWKRILLILGTVAFIIALGGGMLEHEHGHAQEQGIEHVHSHECAHDHALCHDHDHTCTGHTCTHQHDHSHAPSINLLDEQWMNVLFAILSLVIVAVLLRADDHFVDEHLWHHVIRKHLPTVFGWTFGVLLLMGVTLHFFHIEDWISDNIPLMIVLAALVGLIPESGPHLIFVTLFAGGIVPLPVLVASCISQDGHASLPLLAESKTSFLVAKAINCAVALAAGLLMWIF